jgi:aspartyl-tRNA(Asn)/glutamyl-tRNA(Gln) amidotransferase subunit C
MKIDDELITYLEDLSHLTLSPSEKGRLVVDLEKILDSMARLGELSVDDAPEPFDNVNVFREDELRPSFARELILQNAPSKNGEMIIAPKTVG